MRTCTYISELWRKKQSDVMRLMLQSVRYGESQQLPSCIRIIHTIRPEKFRPLGNNPNQVGTGQVVRLFHNSLLNSSIFQRFGISSSAPPQSNENGTVQSGDGPESTVERNDAGAKISGAPDKKADSGSTNMSQSVKRRRSTKRIAFSDSDSDSEDDLSLDDLVKLLGEKEELLKTKLKQMETMQDKVLRNLAETENIMERTKREAENSKKFAIQTFAKGLLDFADNLGRASSVVKDKFAKIDTSEDPAGALPLLKTLLEGVEMTEKQLAEVFKKFGVEKYDPVNEHFDPHRHNAVFQVPDPSKPPNTVTVVLKPGYMLYERIIRPAEVGVTVAVDNKPTDQGSKT